jgi:transcription elongation factor GreB
MTDLISAAGLKRLEDEYHYLWRVERPKVCQGVSDAAAEGDRSENAEYIYGKKRLREIDKRIRFLTKRLDAAEVVDPVRQENVDRIYFGATVDYLDGSQQERRLTIVGVDEVDPGNGKVSWVSPIALAMRGARAGDVINLRTPTGLEDIEILMIRYEPKR